MKLFKRFSKQTKLTLAAVLALCAVAIPAAVFATSGPARATKVYSNGVAGFNYVTFDSFTNVPNIGDERNFFNGLYPGSTAFTDPLPQVKDGDVLTLEVYVHNGADPSLNTAAGQPGIARNTKVRVALPSGIAKSREATAFISATNAVPGTVFDTLDMSAANGGSFEVDYVPGSAHVKGNFIDSALSDSVVTTGATIGSQALDGNVKGCFQQLVLVTLKVKIKMPEYSLAKHVRFAGQTSADWQKNVDAKAGDDEQWLLTFNDNGSTALNAVDIVDQVPAGLTVVPGSVKLINPNYPSGFTYPASAIQDNGRTVHVNIGNYNPGNNAFVMYDTTVNAPAATVCSPFTLTNKAFATPQGFGSIFDTATTQVAGNTCQNTPPPVTTVSTPPTKLVNTGPGEVVGLFSGVSAAGAFGYRRFLSRRLGR